MRLNVFQKGHSLINLSVSTISTICGTVSVVAELIADRCTGHWLLLRKAFRKLDVKSRTQLAHRMCARFSLAASQGRRRGTADGER